MAATPLKKAAGRTADYFNCRLMPHGGPVLFPIVLTTLALCASLADDGCDYARVRGPSVELLTGSNVVPFVDCGMTAYRIPGFYPAENSWRVHFTDECKPYEYMHLLADSSWVAAEWLRFFSLVVGGTTAMFLWTSTCLTLRPNYWKAAGVGSAIACLCQMCSFVWFYTKLCHTSTTNFGDFEAGREVEVTASSATSECTLFFGSKCVITSCVLWGAAAALILIREYPMPVPKLVDQAELINMVHGGTPSEKAQQSMNSRRSNSSFGLANPAKRKGDINTSQRTRLTASMSTAGSANGSLPWVNTPPLEEAGGGDVRASLRTSMRPAEGNRPMNNVRPADLAGSEFSALSFQGASRGR